LAPGESAPVTIAAPEQWQRAARGLREGDFAGANAALRALTRQTSGAEREAAQLALAQLLLSHRQSAEAVPLLRALQTSASLSSVRRKATELLSRREESGAPERSFEGSVETHQP
jgi:thioredoxin-like negative regulator of GroEL